MALQHRLFSLALSALLMAPLAARADDGVATAQQAQNGWTHDDQRDRQERDRWHTTHGVEGNSGNGWTSTNDGHLATWDNGQVPGNHQHIHGDGCYHPAPTPPPPEPPRHRWPRQQGRYELQTVQRWVPGHYEQVWVERDCRYKPRRNVTKCTGGYYDQRWVPGYYQPVQEWVWVEGRRRGGRW
jgi:hypothetical protein